MKKEYVKFVVIGLAVVAIGTTTYIIYNKKQKAKAALAAAAQKAAIAAANPLAKYEGKSVWHGDANGNYIDGSCYLIQGGKKMMYSSPAWNAYVARTSDQGMPVLTADWVNILAMPSGADIVA